MILKKWSKKKITNPTFISERSLHPIDSYSNINQSIVWLSQFFFLKVYLIEHFKWKAIDPGVLWLTLWAYTLCGLVVQLIVLLILLSLFSLCHIREENHRVIHRGISSSSPVYLKLQTQVWWDLFNCLVFYWKEYFTKNKNEITVIDQQVS